MELIKRDDRWDLYNEDGHKIASTLDGCINKLSIKNCQAIELGYDLDELEELAQKDIHNLKPINPHPTSFFAGYRRGFQKALEILGDKKYSIENMREAYNDGMANVDSDGCYIDRPDEDFKDTIQSLQQTEWSVEIVGSGTVYKTVLDLCKNYHPKFGCSLRSNCTCINNEIPKLDADGCLILKRK